MEQATSTDDLLFELAAPERLVMSRRVAMVTVPGSEGDYGVLPKHVPVTTSLKAGMVEIYETPSAQPERIFISGGFAEMTNDVLTVLADSAVPVAELNRAELAGEEARLKAELASSDPTLNQEKIEDRLEIIREILAVI